MCWHVTSQYSAATLPSRSITISNRIIFNQTRNNEKEKSSSSLIGKELHYKPSFFKEADVSAHMGKTIYWA